MDLIEIYKSKYVEEILNLIWNFIAEESFELSKKILPENQIEFLADLSLFQSDYKVIYDYFYVIDRFCNTRIFPQKYNIKYSTKFNRDELDAEEYENLSLIIKILQSDEEKSFEILNRFYPKSSEKYIKRSYNSTKDRYNVDFSGSIWGFKHLHLKEIDRTDKLLYYTIIDNNIYFIAIGNHSDMYKKDILEIVVSEFQHILPNLGIGHYEDMPFDNFNNLSKEDVQRKWVKGENVGFFINEKFFVSVNLMSMSKIKAKLNYEISNTTYQINSQASEFAKLILKGQKTDHDLRLRFDGNIDLSKKELIIEEVCQKLERSFCINYLKNLNTTKRLINVYCK